jgi:hypothetical protein
LSRRPEVWIGPVVGVEELSGLAFRVLVTNQAPDHVTIARFRVRHQQALAGFLVASLRLCAAAGMVRLGLVALDGTKVAANAATSHTLDKLEAGVAEILRQAAETDQREDREYGTSRGDELLPRRKPVARGGRAVAATGHPSPASDARRRRRASPRPAARVQPAVRRVTRR